MYSKGALQYRIALERYPDLAYNTPSCNNDGERIEWALQNLEFTKGASKYDVHIRGGGGNGKADRVREVE